MRSILSFLFLLISLVLGSETGGVKKSNYAIGVSYHENDSIKGTLLSAKASLPLYQLVGLSLLAGSSNMESKDYGSETQQRLLYASLFIRDGSVGILGVSYQQSHIKYDLPSHSQYIIFPDEITIYHTTFYANYFLQDLTLGASQTQYTSDDISDSGDQNSLSVNWYPNLNTRIGISTSGVDDLDEQRYYSVQYQPSFFNKVVDIGVSYSQTKIDDYYDQSYGLSINYYFNTAVDLKSRDRYYR